MHCNPRHVLHHLPRSLASSPVPNFSPTEASREVESGKLSPSAPCGWTASCLTEVSIWVGSESLRETPISDHLRSSGSHHLSRGEHANARPERNMIGSSWRDHEPHEPHAPSDFSIFSGVELLTRSMTHTILHSIVFPLAHTTALASDLLCHTLGMPRFSMHGEAGIDRHPSRPPASPGVTEHCVRAGSGAQTMRSTNYHVPKTWCDETHLSAQLKFTEIYARISFRVTYPKGGTVGAGRHDEIWVMAFFFS